MLRLLLTTLGSIIAMLMLARSVMSSTDAPVVAAANKQVVSSAKRLADTGGDGGEATEIKRGPSGQFHVTAKVNGQDAQFLVDTGADLVSLTIDEAERLGLDLDRSSFQPIVRTASGTGNAARVQIDRIDVAGQEFRDIEALVVEGLDTNLLGQTVLRQMGKVELQGDTLIIHRAS